MAINPRLYPNAGYDPRKDFAPIGLIGSLPSVLVVHPSLPVHSAAELVAYAKANPGKITTLSCRAPSVTSTTELFANTAGIELTRVPYKGNGDALGDLIGGHVDDDGALDRADHRQRQGRHPARAGGDDGGALGAAARRADRSPNPACPASRRRSAMASRRRPARRGRSSTGSTRSFARRLQPRSCARKLAATARCRIAGTPEEYAAAIDAEENKWAPIVKSLNLKIE